MPTYASKLRHLIETHLYAAPGACPWPAQLAALESGAVVECHGFMANLGPGRWQLSADGTATPIL
jgi:hypothetical protein